MYPDRHPSRRHQGGFAILTAIFIIVTLAILGAYAVSISTVQQVGSAWDINGARAYHAARAGTEWGLAHAINDAAPSSKCNGGNNSIGTINNMTVTVVCTVSASGDSVEAGLGNIFIITATACNQPVSGICPGTASTANYIERRVTVMTE